MPAEPTARICSGIRSKSSGDAGEARSITSSNRRGERTLARDGPAHVVLHQCEPWVLGQGSDVGAPAGDQAVDGDDLVTPGHEGLAHEAADEAGAAGHHHPHVRPGRRRGT